MVDVIALVATKELVKHVQSGEAHVTSALKKKAANLYLFDNSKMRDTLNKALPLSTDYLSVILLYVSVCFRHSLIVLGVNDYPRAKT